MGGCASNTMKAPNEKRFKRAIKLYEVTEVKSLTNLLNRNKCFESGESPLTLAAREGHEAVVQTLIASGADVNRLDRNGRGPLHLAVQLNDVETVKILLEARANPNKYDSENATPLHVAAEKGYADIVGLLLEGGANPNECRKGVSPLAYSVVHSHADCVETLLKHGADPNVLDARGNTALHVAVANSDVASAKALLEYKADITAPSRDETGLLVLACLTGCAGAAQLLVDAGCDVNVHRSDEPSTLIAATAVSSADCLDVLLAAGACANAQDKRGQTALQVAVMSITDTDKVTFYGKYFSNVYRACSKYDPGTVSQEDATKCAMSLVQNGALLDAVWDKFVGLFPHPDGISFEQMVLGEVLVQSFGFQSLAPSKLKRLVEQLIRLREYGLLKLMYSAGVDPSWDDQSTLALANEEGDKDMFSWIKRLRTTPRTLQDLGRQKIRRLLSANVLYKVERLPILSQELKDYVCIMDTDHYSIVT